MSLSPLTSNQKPALGASIKIPVVNNCEKIHFSDYNELLTIISMANKNIHKVIFYFTVEDIANLNRFQSETVYVRGVSWYIVANKVERYENGANRMSLGVYLYTNGEFKTKNEVINLCASVQLMPSGIDRKPYQKNFENAFTSERENWGFADFISWQDLSNPANGYIVNGA